MNAVLCRCDRLNADAGIGHDPLRTAVLPDRTQASASCICALQLAGAPPAAVAADHGGGLFVFPPLMWTP